MTHQHPTERAQRPTGRPGRPSGPLASPGELNEPHADAQPPADRSALRDRITALFRCPPGVERLGDATPGEIADAVLAVLPDHAEVRAAVRPRCPHCQLPHDLDPASGIPAMCSSIRAILIEPAAARPDDTTGA